jgi:hypothetical protein
LGVITLLCTRIYQGMICRVRIEVSIQGHLFISDWEIGT